MRDSGKDTCVLHSVLQISNYATRLEGSSNISVSTLHASNYLMKLLDVTFTEQQAGAGASPSGALFGWCCQLCLLLSFALLALGLLVAHSPVACSFCRAALHTW